MTDEPSQHLTDAAFLAAFEDGSLPPSQFRHQDHLRMAYLYLRDHGLGGAIARMTSGLRHYVQILGKTEKYHETVTVAFLALINERLAAGGDPGDWERFAARHPELFERDLLTTYYPAEVLSSDEARRTFVLQPRDQPAS